MAFFRYGSVVMPYMDSKRQRILALLFGRFSFNGIMESLVDIIAVTTGATRVSDATLQ